MLKALKAAAGDVKESVGSRLVLQRAEDLESVSVSSLTQRRGGPPAKQGWLKKLCHNLSSFKNYWFVLVDAKLYCFESQSSSRAQSVLNLNGCRIEVLYDKKLLAKVGKPGQMVMFTLSQPFKRSYTLCAETQSSMEEWIKCIVYELTSVPISKTVKVVPAQSHGSIGGSHYAAPPPALSPRTSPDSRSCPTLPVPSQSPRSTYTTTTTPTGGLSPRGPSTQPAVVPKPLETRPRGASMSHVVVSSSSSSSQPVSPRSQPPSLLSPPSTCSQPQLSPPRSSGSHIVTSRSSPSPSPSSSSSSKTCNSCSTVAKNPDAKFCGQCGSSVFRGGGSQPLQVQAAASSPAPAKQPQSTLAAAPQQKKTSGSRFKSGSSIVVSSSSTTAAKPLGAAPQHTRSSSISTPGAAQAASHQRKLSQPPTPIPALSQIPAPASSQPASKPKVSIPRIELSTKSHSQPNSLSSYKPSTSTSTSTSGSSYTPSSSLSSLSPRASSGAAKPTSASQAPPSPRSASGSCGKCGRQLSGSVIEALGMEFHESCFGCSTCNRPLTTAGRCLNVGGKPYCEDCGKQVFIGAPKKMSETSGMMGLMQWCQNRTAGYQNVQVTDWTKSWHDGLAFCALLHSYRPDLIPFNQLSKGNRNHNIKLAFDVATNKLRIEPLLDAEDFGLEKLSMMTYMSQVYKTLEPRK